MLSDLNFRMFLGCKKESGLEQSKGLALSILSLSCPACPPSTAGPGKLTLYLQNGLQLSFGI